MGGVFLIRKELTVLECVRVCLKNRIAAVAAEKYIGQTSVTDPQLSARPFGPANEAKDFSNRPLSIV